jgi:hypothetical protein
MTVRKGFEGQAFLGVAGSTASTLLENCRDITYGTEAEFGDTTVRGDGTTVPIQTQSKTLRLQTIEITMLHDDADANFEAMEASAAGSDPVAIRTKSYASGKGYDGDCHLAASKPYPMNGEQVVTFTCTPTRDAGRMPIPHA